MEQLLASAQGADHRGTPADRGAVLILLVDDENSGDGPLVLLTRRAEGLRYLPGAITFPGGAIDVSDGGATAAALREAEEEVGLDPTSVEVLGSLADRATPDGRFVVTPVVAWSNQVRFNAPPSPTEVQNMVMVRLGAFSADPHVSAPSPAYTPGPPMNLLPGTVAPLTAAWLTEIATATAR